MIRFGPDAILYGTPDGYVLECWGLDPYGQAFSMHQMFSIQLMEQALCGGWWIIGITAEYISKKMREAGAEPREWICGGWWREDWSSYDEDGTYKW